MKKTTLFLLISFISLFTNGQEHYFRFVETDKNVINGTITKIISIDNIKADTVYAYANNKELESFKKFGYKIEFLPAPSISDSKVINMATDITQMSSWDRYPTYEVYRAMMKKFEQDFPSLCKLDSIGTTVEGRKLYVLKISDNVTTNELEPEVFYTSTMHGDEVTGFVLMLRLIDYFLNNYSTDSRIKSMVDNMAIYINPNANPDGTYNTSNSTVSGSTRYNANNIDINRNFPDPRAGDHPDGYSWQPETQAMMNYAKQRHFILAANFHGGIELVNYPWDTWTSTQNPHPDNSWFNTISRAYADTVHKYSPSDYFTGENNGVTHGGDWYVVTGGRQDYMNYWHQCREVTIEISDIKILSTDLLPSYWNYNYRSFLNYLDLAFKGFNGTVKNSLGEPLNAKIRVLSHDKDSSHVKTNPNFGNYYRPIGPGTYNVQYSAFGYKDQTHTINVASYTSSIIKDVILENASLVNLTGIVTEAQSGNPIDGAKIEIINTNYSPVFTNSSGSYSLNSVYEKQYQIKVSKTGYKQQTKNIDLTTTNNVLDFALEINEGESFEIEIPAGITFSTGDWTRVNNTASDGVYSLKSASIGNNQQTAVNLSLNIVETGEISFARRVSSESGYDFLKFYIDGVEKGSWSGEIAWGDVSYTITTGYHTFQWKYIKDGAYIEGSDCAWIDNISIPTNSQTVEFIVSVNSTLQQGLEIKFNNQTTTTNTEGKSEFTGVLRTKNKPYSIWIQNTKLTEGTVDIYWSNISKPVNFSNYSNVNIEVKSKGVPVNGATVILNQAQQPTNTSGIASFSNVPFGLNTQYSISMSGYESASGQVQVFKDSTYSMSINLTSTEEISQALKSFTINPNPISDKATISLFVETPSMVEISVYDITGRFVKNIFNGNLSNGEHKWYWTVSKGESTPNQNLYFVKLKYNGYVVTKKIVLIN